jgi:hypothetical protein
MMMMLQSMLLVGALAGEPPVWASDFYIGTQTDVDLASGSVQKNGETCCLKASTGSCKVQVQGAGGDTYEEGSMERIRADSAQGQTVSWWGDIKKKFALAPAPTGSAHEFVCVQYCPLAGKFASTIKIGDARNKGLDKVHDEGEKTITQKGPGAKTAVCEHYHWLQTILGVVPLLSNDYYVNQKVSPPVPFYQTEEILNPTAGFAAAGTVNISLYDYTPANQSKMFDIDMDTVKSCTMSKSCNGPAPAPGFSSYGISLVDAAATRTESTIPDTGAPTLTALPTFPSDFTSKSSGLMLIHQGADQDSDGDNCCPSDASQCQVEQSTSEETRYEDFTNKRVRTDDAISGVITVDFFGAIQKTMQVNITNGVPTCVSYCPLHNETMKPFGVDPTAQDLGE